MNIWQCGRRTVQGGTESMQESCDCGLHLGAGQQHAELGERAPECGRHLLGHHGAAQRRCGRITVPAMTLLRRLAAVAEDQRWIGAGKWVLQTTMRHLLLCKVA